MGAKKWQVTPEVDAVIIDAWRRRGPMGHAAKSVQQQIAWPKWRICRRATELGLTRNYRPEREWSEAELGLLREHSWRTPSIIQGIFHRSGFVRSLSSIVLKRKRLKLTPANLTDGYSPSRLGSLLGEDSHKIMIWVRSGLLKAERRGTIRTIQQGGDDYWIRHRDVYVFLLQNSDKIDLCKVESRWFLETITAGKIGVALDEGGEEVF